MAYTPVLRPGDFIRVKESSDFRPGQDGMVMVADDGEAVGLMFGCNRHNQLPKELGVCFTALTEEWLLSELDLESAIH
ncbi:hypothetical protein WL29_23040 [Burkholderia ubonensis]|uniref:Uncharacterized protein n=1 Tax=Burkholderia ubonensis TaxID=101571 RepID=A0A119HFP3_9BURK|nr:hypothetical protein [Burkholderia ubonensis]KWA84239.1 hypothetical protein WL29_23040 [Burkholderia ubonensis]